MHDNIRARRTPVPLLKTRSLFLTRICLGGVPLLCRPYCTQLIVFPPRPSRHFNTFPPSDLANVPNHCLERRQRGERRGVLRREVSNKFLYFFIPLIFNCFSLSPLLTPFYIFLSSKKIHSTRRFWRRLDWGVAGREGRG